MSRRNLVIRVSVILFFVTASNSLWPASIAAAISSRLNSVAWSTILDSHQSSASSEKAPQIALAGSPRNPPYSKMLKLTFDNHFIIGPVQPSILSDHRRGTHDVKRRALAIESSTAVSPRSLIGHRKSRPAYGMIHVVMGWSHSLVVLG